MLAILEMIAKTEEKIPGDAALRDPCRSEMFTETFLRAISPPSPECQMQWKLWWIRAERWAERWERQNLSWKKREEENYVFPPGWHCSVLSQPSPARAPTKQNWGILLALGSPALLSHLGILAREDCGDVVAGSTVVVLLWPNIWPFVTSEIKREISSWTWHLTVKRSSNEKIIARISGGNNQGTYPVVTSEKVIKTRNTKFPENFPNNLDVLLRPRPLDLSQ